MGRPEGSSPGLVCPGCGARGSAGARFCGACGMPLVLQTPPGEAAASARREWAWKVKPQLAEGELRRVTGARNQAEGEFVQALLLEAGVPSLLRRSAGFDVPDFLAAGPRDVLVPEAGLQTAREVLLEAELVPAGPAGDARVAPGRLLAGLVACLAVGVLVAWGLLALLGR